MHAAVRLALVVCLARASFGLAPAQAQKPATEADLEISVSDVSQSTSTASDPAADGVVTAKTKERQEAHRKSGKIFEGVKKWDLAEEAYRAALNAGDEDPKTYIGLAHCLREQDQFDAAQEVVAAGLHLHGNHALLLLEQGQLFRAQNRTGDALTAFEKAHFQDPANNQIREALTAVLLLRGAAIRAFELLSPSGALDATHVDDLQAAAQSYLEQERSDWAIPVLQKALELDPTRSDTYEALAQAYDVAGLTEAAQKVRAQAKNPSYKKKSSPGEAAPALADEESAQDDPERGMLDNTLPPEVRETLQTSFAQSQDIVQGWLAQVSGGKISPSTVLAGILALVVILLLFARGSGRTGDVSVKIDYPTGREGHFTVRITKREQQREKRGQLQKRKANQPIKTSTRFEHYGISRETIFRRIPARKFWVCVEGYCEDAESGRMLDDYFEQKQISVEKDRTTRVQFDFLPDECPVNVAVFWNGQPAERALVGVRGEPTTLRYTRNGVHGLFLAKGRHTLLAGSNDRVTEREITIDNFEPLRIVFDMASDPMVFTGCPGAIEPYLHGELAKAARELLATNPASELGNLLSARLALEAGDKPRAAEHFERGGRILEAAEIFRELGRYEHAGDLFEKGGDLARAGDTYALAGDLSKAGWAYETCEQFDKAIEHYRKAGDTSKVIATFERSGNFYEAALLAAEQRDWSRVIRNLQQVAPKEGVYPEACRLMAKAYDAQGMHDLAVQKMDEAISFMGIQETPLHVFDWYSELLERTQRLDKALEALEEIKRRDRTYPSINTRIDELRKKITLNKTVTAGRSSGSNFVPGAFGNEDRYELLEEIGRGGMGVVYKARDTRLSRIVALKRLPENLKNHPRAVELFLREARSAAALNHSNIVTIHDVDHGNGHYFITMEYLEGRPINAILHDAGRLTPKDVCRIGIQTAAGLQYAHSQRIIHRDIKTGNLFLTKNRIVKIMDFGLAKMLEEVRRSSTVIGGTPYYMAPEQATGDNIDHRADLYAFGVTLYELATGQVPFSDGDITYHHRHTPPPDPREKQADLPAALAELILQLLAKRAEQRCNDAAEVNARLTTIKKLL